MMLRLFIIIFVLCQAPLKSHEIKPAVLDLIIENQSISMDLKLNAEIVLADIDASQYQDTNNSPQSNIYDQYRFQSATELKASIVNHWDKFQDKINVNFEGELTFLDLKEILTVEELNLELPRETNLQIELINLNKKNDVVKHIDKVKLVKGDAVKTIPDYVKKNKSLIVRLLYLDCPIYKPTITALRYFYPLIPKGGVVAFDEIAMEKWKGETIAFKEYFGKNFPKLKRFYFEPSASYFIKE